MSRFLIGLFVLFLLTGCCSSGGTTEHDSVAQVDDSVSVGNDDLAFSCVTVTQKTCCAFSPARNRVVDMKRLEAAARKKILLARKLPIKDEKVVTGVIRGLAVKRVTYLSSDQVEAVFTFQDEK